MVSAFFEVEKKAGDVIISQEEEGDNFYIVDSGECDIYVTKKSETRLVECARAGDYFGELALMYNCPRLATVRARTNVKLFALGQEIFKHLLCSAAQDRRKQYESFLQNVPILKSLTAEERGKIADVLVQTTYADGEYIIRQDEETSDTFFIVYEGEAIATKSAEGAVKEVMKYMKGDYFGELALLKHAPRAANVVAKGRCTVVSIDRASFNRLLGSCDEILRRHWRTYEQNSSSDSDSDSYRDPFPMGPLTLTRRGAVSASPSLPTITDFPSSPKSSFQRLQLSISLKKIILFSHLTDSELDSMVSAFFEVEKKAGDVIISQEEEGDNFYIVDSGECDIYVTKKSETRLVECARAGDYFGELALMYNCPRLATVRARTNVKLFALGQEIFKHLLCSAAQDRRKQYESFLQNVPILKSLTAEERGKIADVLVQTTYADGEYIIRQDEETSDTFFIVYEGEAIATKSAEGAVKEVMKYMKGDYFGELALLKHAPRAANVVAKGRCTVVTINRHSFTRLLGSCSELQQRHYA